MPDLTGMPKSGSRYALIKALRMFAGDGQINTVEQPV